MNSRTCEYCGDPLPEDARPNRKYCPGKSCKQLTYPERKSLENRKNVKRKTVKLTAPESGGYVTQGKKGISNSISIEEHNAIFHFEILADDYYFDTDIDWKLIRARDGKSIGKYTHRHIRDALGFHYDPNMKGKKPPFSVVKGKHTKTIEVFINDGAGITNEAQMWKLLQRIKDVLEKDLNAPLGKAVAVEWKQGSEKGQPIRDYIIPCPVAKIVGQEHPEEIPLQAPKRPRDPHNNAKVDGSHPTAWEVNSRRQAENQKTLIENALDVSAAANDIEITREGVDSLNKRTEELAKKAGLERNGYTRNPLLDAVFRKIKDTGESHSFELTEMIIAEGKTRREIQGLRKGQATTEKHLAQVADNMLTFSEQIGEFGTHIESHTAIAKFGASIMENLPGIVETLKDSAETLTKATEAIEKREKKMEGTYRALEFRKAAGDL